MKKFAIHCETEDLAKQVLQIAHEAGLTWTSGRDSLLDFTQWEAYQEEQCYSLVTRVPGCVLQCSRTYYENKGYIIVKAQDFIEANERHQESILETATV